MNHLEEVRTMFVQYLGDGASWTVDDGRVWIGEREDLEEEEIKACERGGGTLPLSNSIDASAS